mgnify:FL=1
MSNTIKAAYWMIGAMFSFSLMAVSGRELGGYLDTFEIMMYRSLIGVFIVFIFLFYNKSFFEISLKKIKLHFIRNIFHFAGQNLWFFAVIYIPLSQLFAFEFSVPIWVAVLAPIFLKEKLTFVRFFAILVGFVGILIVARPNFSSLDPAIISAALCAVGFAVTSITTKKLTSTESITCILFWLTIMQFIFGFICSGIDGDIDFPIGFEFIWIITIGICGLVAHFCITKALSLAPALVVSPLEFLRLPFISLIGFFIYNENLELIVFFGSIFILAANIINIRNEAKTLETH